MIQIYSPGNTAFDTNGDQVLLPESCEAISKINGTWELNMIHPLDEDGRWKYIVQEAVLSVPNHVGQNQLYTIDEVEKEEDGVIAKAYPIFYDSADELFLYDVRPTDASGQEALDAMTAGSRFSGESNIATKSTAYFEDRNMMDCLNGENEPTFIQRWGGEILYDNFKVIVNEKIGSDNGAEVRYGKNMEHISYSVDMSEMCTRIIPVAYNGRKHSVKYIDSPNIDKYTKKYHRKMMFEEVRLIDDIGEGEDTTEYIVCNSQDELDAVLEEKCAEQFELGIDLPKVTISVDMIMLSKTEEYKDFFEIEKIGLGDTVRCHNKDLDISTQARVIELIWDCIENSAKNVVLGDYKYDYFSQVNSAIGRIESAIRPNGTVVAEKVKGILDAMETSLRLQSSAAKKVDGRAFLIEDLDPESPLYGAMSFGTQGLEIAKEKDAENKWIWKTAITATGGILGSVITGLISDKTGSNYWDLEKGKMVAGDATFTGTIIASIIKSLDETFSIDAKGNIVGASIKSTSGGNWSIDDQGNMTGKNLSIEDSISTETINCSDIRNKAYPKTLVSSPTIYVNASTGDDDNECVSGAIFQTLQGAINSIPRFLNGKTVYIELQNDVTENIRIPIYAAGTIYIYLAGHTIYGNIYGHRGHILYIYGGTKSGGGADKIGSIHPSVGYASNNYSFSFFATTFFHVVLNALKIYGSDTLVSGTANKVCVGVQGKTYCYIDNIEIVNTDFGFRANSGGQIHSSASSGMAGKTGFAATTGGYVTLYSGNQAGGVSANTSEAHGGTVKYHNPTFESGSVSSSDNTASTEKTTKTAAYTASLGNAIQYYGTSSAKWRSDNTPKVGSWGYGAHTAWWFFGDEFENMADKDVTKVVITFTRNDGGNHGDVTHRFYVHGYETKPSTVDPNYTNTIIGTAAVDRGEKGTLTITNSTYLNLIKKAKGICSIPPSQTSAYYSVMSSTMKVKFYYEE